MKKIFFMIIFTTMFVSWAHAGEGKRIELTDGSVLEGEIVSFAGGQYAVRSPTLGTLQIADSKVRAVRNANATLESHGEEIANLSAADVSSEMQKVQSAMTSNPDMMKTVAGLISDPEFLALAKDPEIINAAKSLDMKTLLANEKFVSVLNNPTIGEIKQNIKKEDDPQN